MPRLSRRALALNASATRALATAAARHDDAEFIYLNIGQPDLATPPPVLEAMRNWQPRVLAYGPSLGLPECRAAAAKYHGAWGDGLQATDVAVTTGGSEALVFALMATCDSGDEVLIPEPYYTNYNGFANMAGVEVRALPTRLDEGFALPSDEALDAAVTPKTRAILFSNPGNPTGAVYGAETIGRIVRWAKRHDIFVISDEVYRRIWFGDEPPASALSYDAHDHVLCIDSMSKTYSGCGLRLGFLICRNEELMERVERFAQARLSPQPLAQIGAIAALELDDAYYEDMREAYRARVSALSDALDALDGVNSHRPEGAFYAMVDLPVDNAMRFGRFLVDEFRSNGQSVVVAPGAGFYANAELGERQVRLAAVDPPERLARAVEIIGEALLAYPGSR